MRMMLPFVFTTILERMLKMDLLAKEHVVVVLVIKIVQKIQTAKLDSLLAIKELITSMNMTKITRVFVNGTVLMSGGKKLLVDK